MSRALKMQTGLDAFETLGATGRSYNSSAWFFLSCAGYHINSHTNSLVPHGNTSAYRPCTLQGIGAAHCDALKTSRA